MEKSTTCEKNSDQNVAASLSGSCNGVVKDYFFKTLSFSVHPIIILRLLFHKMFGGMVKKKAANIPKPTVEKTQNEFDKDCLKRTNTDNSLKGDRFHF